MYCPFISVYCLNVQWKLFNNINCSLSHGTIFLTNIKAINFDYPRTEKRVTVTNSNRTLKLYYSKLPITIDYFHVCCVLYMYYYCTITVLFSASEQFRLNSCEDYINIIIITTYCLPETNYCCTNIIVRVKFFLLMLFVTKVFASCMQLIRNCNKYF